MVHCNQCDLDWEPRVENPRACTRCKRYDWNQPKKGVKIASRPATRIIGGRKKADGPGPHTSRRGGVEPPHVDKKPQPNAARSRVGPVSDGCPLHGAGCGFAKGSDLWYCSQNRRVYT